MSAATITESCAYGARQARAVVALDEAFAAARPSLAAKLQAGSLFGRGSAGLIMRDLMVPVALSEGAGKALDAALAESERSGESAVLVASPLIAKAIVTNGTWAGIPPLLVPEWHGETLSGEAAHDAVTPGLWTAVTDPVPAYGAAGAASGAFIAFLANEGGTPSCGILFSEAPSRPRAALTSFASAYADASEGRPLFVRVLGEEGSTSSNDAFSSSGKSGAQSEASAARAAVTELLGSDIRVLFVALGSASGAAIEAAARPGLAIGADSCAREPSIALAFRIYPDDTAIARALAGDREVLRDKNREDAPNRAMESVAAIGGAETEIPSLLVAGPAATKIRAGRLDFAHFLSLALRQRPFSPLSRPARQRCARKAHPKATD
jgi:hypothetical protein